MKEAIILAGGFGTRLQHVINDVPKPMAPINGRPFLTYLFQYLSKFDFGHIVLSTGYLHEKIEDYYGDHYQSMTLSYAPEITPLGTGGGILNALQQCNNEDVMILNGDTMFCADYNLLFDFYRQRKTDLAIILRKVDDTSRYGSVQIDENQRIMNFTEKFVSIGKGLINGGIYLLNKRLMQDFQVGQNFSFEKDIMEKRVYTNNYYAQVSDGYFIDIGVPEDYYRAQKEL